MFRKKPDAAKQADQDISEAVRLQMKSEQIQKTGMSTKEHDDVMSALGMPGYEPPRPNKK